MLPLYDKIADLCRAKEKSVTQMCTEANVPRSALSDYKSGKNKTISINNLQKIADYFDISIDELLGNEKKPLVNNDQELTEYLDELKNRKEMRMLFSLAKGATKADVERAVAIIEALQKQGE